MALAPMLNYRNCIFLVIFTIFFSNIVLGGPSEEIARVAGEMAKSIERQLADSKYYGEDFAKRYLIRSVEQIRNEYRSPFLLQILKKSKNVRGLWKIGQSLFRQYVSDFDAIFEALAYQPELNALYKFEILDDFIKPNEKNALYTRFVMDRIAKGQLDLTRILAVLPHFDKNVVTLQDFLIFQSLLEKIEPALQSRAEDKLICHNIDQYVKSRYDAFGKEVFRSQFRLACTEKNAKKSIELLFMDLDFNRHALLLTGKASWPVDETILEVKRMLRESSNLSKIADLLRSFLSELPAQPVKNTSIRPQDIVFVASTEPSGDGHTPSTLDVFMKQQYPWLSLLFPKLIERGFRPFVVSWEDPTIDWSRYPVLYIGPVWGYSRQSGKFQEWLAHLEKLGTKVVNSSQFLNWNVKKTYLADLQNQGIPVVPTTIIPSDTHKTWVEVIKDAEEKFGTSDVILKGVVGAGGFDYLHYDASQESKAVTHFQSLLQNHAGAVVQPFLKEVRENGELSFTFYGNVLSHFFVKVPAPKEVRVQVFYGGRSFHLGSADFSNEMEELLSKIREFRPDTKLDSAKFRLAFGKVYSLWSRVQEYLQSRQMGIPLMVRLDCVVFRNDLVIMEIEGVEPYLEISEALKSDKSENPLTWYVDAIIRQHRVISSSDENRI